MASIQKINQSNLTIHLGTDEWYFDDIVWYNNMSNFIEVKWQYVPQNNTKIGTKV